MASQRILIVFALTLFTCLLNNAYCMRSGRDTDVTEAGNDDGNEKDAEKSTEKPNKEESVENKDDPTSLEERNEETLMEEDISPKSGEPAGEDDNKEYDDDGGREEENIVSENDQKDKTGSEEDDANAGNDGKDPDPLSIVDEEMSETSISDQNILFNFGFSFDSPFFSFDQIQQNFRNFMEAYAARGAQNELKLIVANNTESLFPMLSETRRKRNAHYSAQLARSINDTIEEGQKARSEGLRSLPCRYAVAALCFLCVFMLSVQRVSVTFAIMAMVNGTITQMSQSLTEDSVMELCPGDTNLSLYGTKTKSEIDYNWTTKQMTYVLISNYVGYLVFLIAGGRLAENWNAKKVLNLSIIISSIFNLVSPWCYHWGVYSYIGTHFFKGMVQAAILPTVNYFIACWFPPEEKATMVSLIYFGGSFGSLVGDIILGILRHLDFLVGWPIVFYVFGVMGCVCSIFLTLILHDSPQHHPTISKEEFAYITKRSKQDNFSKTIATPWREMCISPPALALIVSTFGQYWVAIYFLSIHPMYLENMLHFPLTEDSLETALLYAPQFVVMLVVGPLSDFLISRKCAKISTVRKAINTISCVMYSACFIGLCFARCHKWINMIISTLAMAAMGLMPSGIMIVSIDMSPTFAGTLTGICSTAGVMSAVILPLVTGAAIDKEQTLRQWRIVFLTTMSIAIMSGIIFLIFGSAEVQPWNNTPDPVKKPVPTISQTLQHRYRTKQSRDAESGNIIECTHL